MTRKIMPSRRGHITQKATIANRRTVYLSVDDVVKPNEVFLRVKGNANSELICCFDVIARLISLCLQAGIDLPLVVGRLHGTRSEPAGAVVGDDRVKFCDGTLDYVGKHLLIQYCGRDDLAQVIKKELS